MARLRAAESDLSTALELLDEAERVYLATTRRTCNRSTQRVLAARGDITKAGTRAGHQEVATDDELSYLREYEHITLARVLLAEHAATGSSQALQDAGGSWIGWWQRPRIVNASAR